VTTALKAAVYLSLRDQKVSKSELARRMNLDEKEARRMLNPRHATKVPTLERALAVLGRRAEIEVTEIFTVLGAAHRESGDRWS